MDTKYQDKENLGQKHRNYNKTLQEIISKKQTLSNISDEKSDIENLLMIDLASHERNVEYILEVLKSDDMLYVSRALSKSTWLVTDPKYSNIINPEYLKIEMLPHMTSKAYSKLIKHVRHNINDTERAESFYLDEKNPLDALKWLPHCSVPFIESNITKHDINKLELTTFKRLCEKSITTFEIIFKTPSYDRTKRTKAVTFFLNTDIDKYLDIIENKELQSRSIPRFNAKSTKKIMSHSSKRIIDQFEKYVRSIDLPTFAKHIKGDEIIPFLNKQASKLKGNEHSPLRNLFKRENLIHLIRRIPKNEQIELVRKMLSSKDNSQDVEMYLRTVVSDINNFNSCYLWYQFLDFEEAFEMGKIALSIDVSKRDKYSLLSTLVICANNNPKQIQALVQYYSSNNINEEFKYKLQFATDLLNRTMIYEWDERTWEVVNELFKSLKIYESNDNENTSSDITECVNSIILYLVIHDQPVAPVIEKKFAFNTMKRYQFKLNAEQRENVFRFLLNNLLRNLQKPINNKDNLSETIKVLEKCAELLKDWKKSLVEYPDILQKIKEVVKLNKAHGWKVDLTILYKKGNPWRRYIFEESLLLNPCEEVCLNVLKHNPQLLEKCNDEVTDIHKNASISLRCFLNKLRIYWPNTISTQWIDTYSQKLSDDPKEDTKAIIRSLCILLPKAPLLKMFDKYIPEQTKVDWSKIDGNHFTIQQVLAKNMHKARPQPPPTYILSFARGDYLQHALPSLHAIFSNMKLIEFQKHITTLLDAPVSVQKHGIRFAFKRLNTDTVKNIFLAKWTASKNISIRAIVFTFTYELLSNEKNDSKAAELWDLLGLFIDNLTMKEDKKIYEILSKVETVPSVVKAEFLIKNYHFLEKLAKNAKDSDRNNYEWQREELARYITQIIETIDQGFVQNVIQEYFVTNVSLTYPIVAAYLLSAGDEDNQKNKYENILLPFITDSLNKWNEKRDDKFNVRTHIRQILSHLNRGIKDHSFPKKKPIPVKMFVSIQQILEKSLTVADNYVILTQWKLVVAITKLISELRDCKDWDEICTKSANRFGKISLGYLKHDESRFPHVYPIFSKILNRVITDIAMPDKAVLDIYNCFLSSPDFIQSYLTVIEINSANGPNPGEIYSDLWRQLSSHPSKEVQMHFNHRIGREILAHN